MFLGTSTYHVNSIDVGSILHQESNGLQVTVVSSSNERTFAHLQDGGFRVEKKDCKNARRVTGRKEAESKILCQTHHIALLNIGTFFKKELAA